MKEAIIYLLAITAAEVITVGVGLVWGISSHIVLLVALIVHASLELGQRRQPLLLSLSLMPLTRIISLSMPLARIPQVWWYPIIYMPLLAAAMAVARVLGYRLDELGLNFKRILIQLAVALTGVVFGVAEYFILTAEARETFVVLRETWLLSAFLLMVSTGFVEEFIFRGVLQRSTMEFGWWGIVYTSLVFAVVHLIHYSLIDVVFVFGVALFFSWVVKKTGSLLGVTLSHGVTNILLYLVAPFFF